MFRRRDARSTWRALRELIYPTGGWIRASSYVWHRLRRLPDDPGRIARGLAVGVLISFTPLLGFHLLCAGLLAWVVRGSIPAALIGTFVGNPLTFPLISAGSLEVGYLLTAQEERIPIYRVPRQFSEASAELWRNLESLFSPAPMHWEFLHRFWIDVFLPYLVGGSVLGVLAGLLAYGLSLPVLRAYDAARRQRTEERLRRARAKFEAEADDDAAKR